MEFKKEDFILADGFRFNLLRSRLREEGWVFAIGGRVFRLPLNHIESGLFMGSPWMTPWQPCVRKDADSGVEEGN